MVIVAACAIASLTFGASELLAGNAASQCGYFPPHELGVCTSEKQCQAMCESVGGSLGDCSTGCCGCRL